jgi:hypothetical protein
VYSIVHGFMPSDFPSSDLLMFFSSIHCQLADFVRIPLEKAGGMIALVDVYCLFNRARGTGPCFAYGISLGHSLATFVLKSTLLFVSRVDLTRRSFASMFTLGES